MEGADRRISLSMPRPTHASKRESRQQAKGRRTAGIHEPMSSRSAEGVDEWLEKNEIACEKQKKIRLSGEDLNALTDTEIREELGLSLKNKLRLKRLLEQERNKDRLHETYTPSVKKPKQPVVLLCQLNVQYLSSIDIVSQTFDVSLTVEAQLCKSVERFAKDWQKVDEEGSTKANEKNEEPLIFFDNTDITMSALMRNPRLWNPKLHLVNAKKLSSSDFWATAGGRHTSVYYKYHFEATLFSQLSLYHFPFDQQALHIVLSSHIPLYNQNTARHKSSLIDVRTPDHTSSSLCLLLIPRPEPSRLLRVATTSGNLMVSWDIHREIVNTYVGATYPILSLSEKVYPLIQYTLFVNRKPQYFIINIMLPMFALATLGFVIYLNGNDAESSLSRIRTVMTLILSCVTYKIVIGNTLPDIPYATFLDDYVNLCFGLLLLFVADIAAAELLSEEGEDLISGGHPQTLGLLWLCVHLYQLQKLGFIQLHRYNCTVYHEDGIWDYRLRQTTAIDPYLLVFGGANLCKLLLPYSYHDAVLVLCPNSRLKLDRVHDSLGHVKDDHSWSGVENNGPTRQNTSLLLSSCLVITTVLRLPLSILLISIVFLCQMIFPSKVKAAKAAKKKAQNSAGGSCGGSKCVQNVCWYKYLTRCVWKAENQEKDQKFETPDFNARLSNQHFTAQDRDFYTILQQENEYRQELLEEERVQAVATQTQPNATGARARPTLKEERKEWLGDFPQLGLWKERGFSITTPLAHFSIVKPLSRLSITKPRSRPPKSTAVQPPRPPASGALV